MTDQTGTKTFNFELFRSTYKPHVRSLGLEKQIETAFGIDPEFKVHHGYLRKFLLADRINWAEDIISHLSELDVLSDTLSMSNLNILRGLYRTHTDLFRIGDFGEAYLDSIEDIALFFIHIDVKTIWVVGAYRELSLRLIDLIVDRSKNNRNLPLNGTMRALSTALLIEINQIQRTFTMYERYVSNALVRDLNRSDFFKELGGGEE